MTTGDAVASWYRHSIALPSSSRLVLLPSPPPPTPTNGPFEPASLSLSLYVHIHGGENTHTPIFSMCRRVRVPRIFPAMPVNSQARRGVEREREKGRACAQTPPFILPLRLFPPLADIFSLRGSRSTARTEHTRRYFGRRASEKEGRSSVRISADSRSFSCLLSSHSPPSSRPTSVNRERGHKAYA